MGLLRWFEIGGDKNAARSRKTEPPGFGGECVRVMASPRHGELSEEKSHASEQENGCEQIACRLL